MSKINKVIILTPFYYPNVGGAETFAADLVKELSRRYAVRVVTVNWGKQKIWRGINWLGSIRILAELFIKMFGKKADKVYALGLNAGFIARLIGIKYSVTMLALYNFKSKGVLAYLSRIVLNGADKVFVEGQRGKVDLLPLGIAEHKIVKFQHWCDQEVFKPIERNWPELRVLFVGRPIPEKGIGVVRAIEQGLKGKDIKFTYVENVPYKDLPQYYQMADVVLVPSQYDEGYSKVVIEAASCGCAIIASNRGALPEMIQGWGMVIEPKVSSFTITLLELTNKVILKTIQLIALDYARKNFSPKNAQIF